MFQVCVLTWNSSLNRAELFEHLRIAHSKGGYVFQSAQAENTRRFLKCVLDGKGLPVTCVPNPQHQHQSTDALATMQSVAGLHSLFVAALSRAEPLWFHPSSQWFQTSPQQELNEDVAVRPVRPVPIACASAAAASLGRPRKRSAAALKRKRQQASSSGSRQPAPGIEDSSSSSKMLNLLGMVLAQQQDTNEKA